MRQTFREEAVYVSGSRLRCDHLLWGLVLAAAAGDLVLTLFGLSLCFTEANPVARAVLDVGGGAGLLALKLTAVALLFAIYQHVRPLYRRAALVAFFVPQLLAVGHNSLLLAQYAAACP
ncbi:DUF5658 family protein [Haloarcula sp. S1CR25-12]|uniref:DUF5658 family protein n=1 Tax=Haloarcula saliterrae TaxID=2950534 RepID=A0ABU2F8E5_9EURY|nr:DUF5658 family protein [Haloarcula sp. S1CR25-12]MDS0258491.1 DUF5658 family protein [Haloarcula sp. S1CR25-12]